MKNQLAILALIWAFSLGIIKAGSPDLIPFRKADKWGYCNANGTLVIPPAFESATPFVSARAVAQSNGKMGLIDGAGNWIIPPAYNSIRAGHHYCVEQNGKFGLMDAEGNTLQAPEMNEVIALRGNNYLLYQGPSRGLVNALGCLAIPVAYEHIAQLRDVEGNYLELFEVWENGKRGIYDVCGNLLQAPQFDHIGVFKEGFAVVKAENGFGLIDLLGNLRIACEYEQLIDASEGLVAAKVKNRWGFIDTDGQQKVDFLYEEVQHNGFHQGRAAVKQAGGWHFIQRDGRVELPFDQGFQSIGELSEGMVAVCKLEEGGGVAFGYADISGQLRVNCKYERAEAFRKGYAIVGKRLHKHQSMVQEMRYGLIDRKGKEILPCVLKSQTEARLKRDSISHLGYATFQSKGRTCKVDYAGRKFDRKRSKDWDELAFLPTGNCANASLKPISKNDQWGFADASGKIVIPCQYALVQCFENGLAKVWPEQGTGLCFYIDEQGKRYYEP